jgi:hypothetical protein
MLIYENENQTINIRVARQIRLQHTKYAGSRCSGPTF